MYRTGIFFVIFFLNGVFARGQNTLRIRIFHFNDVHARVEPAASNQAPCTARDAQSNSSQCYGGLPKLAAKAVAFREQQVADPDSLFLVLDAGDEFMGTIWNTFYKGEAIAAFLDLIKPDAFTFGNHEFDFDSETLAKFINNIQTNGVTSCNVDLSSDPAFAYDVPKYILKTTGGATPRKVAIIGYTTPDTVFLSSPSDDVHFTDELEALSSCIAQMDSEVSNVDAIVLLGHSGYLKDQEIARKVDRRVVVIVGGHSHTLLGSPENVTSEDAHLIGGAYPTWVTNENSQQAIPVVQAYWASKYAGEAAEVVVDLDSRKVTFEGAPIVLSDFDQSEHYVADDPAAAALVKKMAAALDDFRTAVIGNTTVDLDGEQANTRMKETNLADLICDAMLHKCAGAAELCMTNGGGVRASISKGNVTVEHVLTVLPFGNQISIVELRGRTLRLALEQGLSVWSDGPVKEGRFPQVGGLRYSFNPHLAPMARLLSLTDQDGLDIADEKSYRLATNEFMVDGGDGYAAFSEATVINKQVAVIADALMDYFADFSPISIEVDGRILIVRNSSDSDETSSSTGDDWTDDGASADSGAALKPLILVLLTIATPLLFR